MMSSAGLAAAADLDAEMLAAPPPRSEGRHHVTAVVRREVLRHSPHYLVPKLLGIGLRHDPARELEELRGYLGAEFDERSLSDWRLLDEELAQIGDETDLYRRSHAYLYNLTAFAMGATKDPYLAVLESTVPPPARLLDYGCGIGSDGLCLMDVGYRVGFADFANPSTDYLRWRLARRGYRAPVFDIEAAPPPAGFALAYAFDVLEHVPDPFALLAVMQASAPRVLVNLLDVTDDDTDVHHELPLAEILRFAIDNGLQSYSCHYGCSHLILYEPGAPARPGAVKRARRAVDRLDLRVA